VYECCNKRFRVQTTECINEAGWHSGNKVEDGADNDYRRPSSDVNLHNTWISGFFHAYSLDSSKHSVFRLSLLHL
jgi:hypothetical protein